jgi:hypothetical protein
VVDREHGNDPVFVDRTGRRRRLIALAGSAGGLMLTLILLALVAGFTGVGPASVPGWPDAAAGVPGARAKPSPSPASPSARSRPLTAEPPIAEQAPAGDSSRSAVPDVTPSSATVTPSGSVTPTPKNNGRRPTHTPNPRSSKKN